MIVRNKRGMQMAISTIVLLVLGMVLLVGLISLLIMNWERFSDTIRGYSGSEEQVANDLCNNQCGLVRNYDFCCSKKVIDGIEKTCIDLNIECNEIDCTGVC